MCVTFEITMYIKIKYQKIAYWYKKHVYDVIFRSFLFIFSLTNKRFGVWFQDIVGNPYRNIWDRPHLSHIICQFVLSYGNMNEQLCQRVYSVILTNRSDVWFKLLKASTMMYIIILTYKLLYVATFYPDIPHGCCLTSFSLVEIEVSFVCGAGPLLLSADEAKLRLPSFWSSGCAQ